MTYRLSLAVDDNVQLEIEEPDFPALLDVFEKMGGKRDWLINSARASVARSLHGEGAGNIVRSMNGEVIEDRAATAEDAVVVRQRGSGGNRAASATRTAPRSESPADPWASDRDYPGEASVARETLSGRRDDGWGPDDTSPASGGRQRRPEARAEGAGAGITRTTDRFDREWVMGLPEAPLCDCGEPAARVKAKAQGSGKWYTTFKCAKGAGTDWQDKCGFSEFPPK